MACWPVKVQTEGCMHLNLNYSINYGGDRILLMSVKYGGRQSCMIDVIYCGCPSLMNMMDVHHVWRMDASHICMMDVHHIWCFTVINFHHICERPSWWKQWNLLGGRINWKDIVNFEVHMELMESEVREYWEYGADWINGNGEREIIIRE